MNTVWTVERRKKLSDSCKGKIPWNKNKKGVQKGWSAGKSSYPAVCQFNLKTGQLIKIFETEQQAAKSVLQEGSCQAKLNTITGRIHLINLNGYGHAYGYIWRFITNYANITQLGQEELSREHRPARAKAILQLDLAGNFIQEFESSATYSKILEAEDRTKQRKLAKKLSTACYSGKAAFGYLWKYKDL